MSTNSVCNATHIYRRTSDPTVIRTAATAIVENGKAFTRYVKRRARINADRRRLSQMPDHMLKDIGIGRSEINFRTEFGRAEDHARLLGLKRN